MNRYWLKIAAGSLLVFGVGMAGISLGKKSLHELKTAVGVPVAQALQSPANALRFRLDGRQVGRIEAIEVQSDGQWAERAVQLQVRLDDPASAGQLGGCGIAGQRHRGGADNPSFRCVTEEAAGREGLVQVGEVAFEPAGVTRPLYLTERDRRSLERSDIRGLRGTLRSADGQTIDGQASFDVQDRSGARERGVVRIQAGQGKALIDIRDESGKELFRLDAGDHGVSLNARDRRGRNLVRLLAGQAGLDLLVDQP